MTVQTPTRCRFRTRLVVALLALLAPTIVWAQPFATVEAIAVPSPQGQWVPSKQTPNAAVVIDEKRIPLSKGMELEIGAHLVTDRAQVTIRFASGEHITVSEDADITLGDRSLLQRLGEVYYQLRGRFRIDYGTVQTAVEGTEFSVVGPDPVTVVVTTGTVRVESAGESILLDKGTMVSVGQGATPPPPQRTPLSVRRSTIAKSWTGGRPKLEVGGVAGGGLAAGSVGADLRGFAAIRILPVMNLVVDTGLSGMGGDPGIRLPIGLGLEASLGSIALGGEVISTLENRRYSCGGRYAALHIGGVAKTRVSMTLTRRLSLIAIGRIGHAGDGLIADIGYGMGVGL